MHDGIGNSLFNSRILLLYSFRFERRNGVDPIPLVETLQSPLCACEKTRDEDGIHDQDEDDDDDDDDDDDNDDDDDKDEDEDDNGKRMGLMTCF